MIGLSNCEWFLEFMGNAWSMSLTHPPQKNAAGWGTQNEGPGTITNDERAKRLTTHDARTKDLTISNYSQELSAMDYLLKTEASTYSFADLEREIQTKERIIRDLLRAQARLAGERAEERYPS